MTAQSHCWEREDVAWAARARLRKTTRAHKRLGVRQFLVARQVTRRAGLDLAFARQVINADWTGGR